MTALVKLDFAAIKKDLQHRVLLEQVADEIVERAAKNTRVDIQPARSEVLDGPMIIIGAKAASAVSVEFGTRYRYASAPIRRAAQALGLKVPN